MKKVLILFFIITCLSKDLKYCTFEEFYEQYFKLSKSFPIDQLLILDKPGEGIPNTPKTKSIAASRTECSMPFLSIYDDTHTSQPIEQETEVQVIDYKIFPNIDQWFNESKPFFDFDSVVKNMPSIIFNSIKNLLHLTLDSEGVLEFFYKDLVLPILILYSKIEHYDFYKCKELMLGVLFQGIEKEKVLLNFSPESPKREIVNTILNFVYGLFIIDCAKIIFALKTQGLDVGDKEEEVIIKSLEIRFDTCRCCRKNILVDNLKLVYQHMNEKCQWLKPIIESHNPIFSLLKGVNHRYQGFIAPKLIIESRSIASPTSLPESPSMVSVGPELSENPDDRKELSVHEGLPRKRARRGAKDSLSA